jgi:DNA ligase-1
MTDQFSPMLAAKAPANLWALFKDLPKGVQIVVQPKLDGVRAMVRGGIVLSRSLKPIPNAFVQQQFGRPEFEGLDGELIVGSAKDGQTFRRTTAAVMSRAGDIPNLTFYVFDNFDWDMSPYFARRMDFVSATVSWPAWSARRAIFPIEQHDVKTADELLAHYADFLSQGYEGLILRRDDAPYKFGRSTTSEAYLLKLKPTEDAEALVIGTSIRLRDGALSALRCRNIDGQEFRLGAGFSEADRQTLPDLNPIGKIIKYAYSPGAYTAAPRHPVFLGFRDKRDLA